MSITRAQVDRDAEVSPPTTLWRQYTVTRMQKLEISCSGASNAQRYEVVKTYNPNGFFHSNKHYARVQQDGSLQLMTEVEARSQHGGDVVLHGYVECDAAWSPL